MEQMIQSAALYCKCEHEGYVSLEWLEGALQLLRSNGLRPREYTVTETPACPEGSYVFRNDDPRLQAAARSGVLRDLYLYCHPQKRRGLIFDWDGVATVRLSSGYVHIGIPESCGVTLSELLRQSYFLARPLASWGYGIAYLRLSSRAPGMYAIGIIGGHPPYPDVTRKDRDRISCWSREFDGRCRHLRGLFRDVYPANLLSSLHVNASVGRGKTLLTSGWGEFARLDEAMWLWTVPEGDIPTIRAALERADLIICP